MGDRALDSLRVCALIPPAHGHRRIEQTSAIATAHRILGTANIARALIAGVAPSETVGVTAIASRDIDQARRFADETGVARAYGSYQELLDDPAIDAIYNPLPNTLHAPWSIRACEAGKHVLCEKPLAVTGSEARAMFAAARRHGVILVEGFPYRAQPHALN